MLYQSKTAKIHIIGDFNVNLYNPSSKHAVSYLDSVFSNGLHPIISRATHFMGRNPTCIDHILTNDIENILYRTCVCLVAKSFPHHVGVFCTPPEPPNCHIMQTCAFRIFV